MKKSWPLLTIVILLAVCHTTAARAGACFDEGLRLYNGRHYRESVVLLARASGAEPLNAIVHYYLANALALTKDHEQAAAEYRMCYLLDPHGPVSGYCRQALVSYRCALPGAEESRWLKEGLTASGVWSAGGQSGGGAVADEKPVDQACSVIRRQLAYEKTKHKVIGDANAQTELSCGEEQARRIEQQAQSEINSLYSPTTWVGPFRFNPYANDAALLKAREEQIRSAARDREEQARRLAQDRADRYKSWSKETGTALDEVADNLERQLSQPSHNGGVQLQAVGTDLYVRYYGGLAANHVIPDVHPAVVRIFGRRSAEPQADSGGCPGDEPADKKDAERSVRGKVLE